MLLSDLYPEPVTTNLFPSYIMWGLKKLKIDNNPFATAIHQRNIFLTSYSNANGKDGDYIASGSYTIAVPPL